MEDYTQVADIGNMRDLANNGSGLAAANVLRSAGNAPARAFKLVTSFGYRSASRRTRSPPDAISAVNARRFKTTAPQNAARNDCLRDL
jgi:hypothetical protein